MVNNLTLDAVYGAIADPTRRGMMERLRSGRMSVSELAAPLPMTLAAVGKHLTVLEHAGLVRTTKQGRVRSCELVPGRLDDATEWIERQRSFWTAGLDALEARLTGER